MSDSEGSIDADILRRITRRRKTASGLPPKNKKTSKKPSLAEPAEDPVVDTVEETAEDCEVFTTEKIPVEPKVEKSSLVEPDDVHDTEEVQRLEEEKRLEKAHTEAKKLKRQQLKGEVKPSSKIQKIVKKRQEKKRPSSFEEEGGNVLEELARLRQEVQQLRESKIQSEPAASQYNDRENFLLSRLMGRF